MPYQKPVAAHPWRQYKDRKLDRSSEPNDPNIKPVKMFLTEIVESWECVSVNTYAYGKEGVFKLSELPQRKIAAWLAGILKRNYGQESQNQA